MYKLSLIAAALFASQAASAAEVYKTDDADVNLYGKVYAGHIYGDAERSANYGSNQFVRFGAKANSDVTDELSAFMRYEVQMYFANSEKIIAENENNLRVRLAYAGVEGDWGKVSFGRNYGAVELVSDWTDQSFSDPFGQEALGVGSDKRGTARSSSLLKYQGEYEGFQLDGSIKLRNSSEDNNSDYGLALAYNFDSGVSLGAGYSVEISDIFDEEDADKPEKPQLILAGIKYELDGFYTALNVASGKNFRGSDIDHTGIEAALGYSFENGISLMSLYNKGQLEEKDGTKLDFANSITAGIKYQLNKPFSVLAEYRMVMLDDDEAYDDVADLIVNQDELALAAVYSF